MADRDDFTTPTPSDPPSTPARETPSTPGFEWERYNAFRATFLYLFLPDDRATFMHCGRLLYNLITEAPALALLCQFPEAIDFRLLSG